MSLPCRYSKSRQKIKYNRGKEKCSIQTCQYLVERRKEEHKKMIIDDGGRILVRMNDLRMEEADDE